MSYDFNGAERQQGHDPIPAGTIVPLIMTLRPGGSGEGGWLKPSNSSDALMLDCEFIVTSGPYIKRKLWQYMTVSGGKVNEHGDSIAGNITRSTLRAILESARGIRPDDMSEAAVQARRISGWQDFSGMVFLAKVGVEKDKDGKYADKNRIQTVITPDMKEYATPPVASVQGAPSIYAAPITFVPPASAPAWAQSAASAMPTSAPIIPSESMPPASSNPVPAWAR